MACLAPRRARVFSGLLAFLVATGAGAADGVLELPRPVGPTDVRAVALRATLESGAGGLLSARVSLTLTNGGNATEALTLVLPVGAEDRPSLEVLRIGQPLGLLDGATGPEAVVPLEPGEVVVLEVRRRLRPEVLPGLAAPRAGWWGATRGPLLQPLRRVTVRHADGSPFADAAVEVRIRPDGRPLASGLIASPGAAGDDGTVTWNLGRGGPAIASLAWPVTETESVLPRDEAEARAFRREWTEERELSAREVGLVREGLRAARGESVAGDVAGHLTPTARPGWAFRHGPANADEEAAARVLAEFEAAAERGTVRVAAARPRPSVSAPTASATPEAETPAAAAPAPPRPSIGPASRLGEPVAPAAARRRPPTGRVDVQSLVTQAPDSGWRRETLFVSRASVPDTPAEARRAVLRVLRRGPSLSRLVLLRESVAALHGKQWAPGYVAEFFSRKPWYEPRPDFDLSHLSAAERQAWEVLDEHVRQVAADVGAIGLVEAPEDAPTVSAGMPATEAPIGPRVRVEPAPPLAAADPPPTRVAVASPAERRRAVLTAIGDVPWLRDADSARVFLLRERSAGGPDPERLRAAMALTEARSGRPFRQRPELRAFFDETPWYQPDDRWTRSALSHGSREALTLLGNALRGLGLEP